MKHTSFDARQVQRPVQQAHEKKASPKPSAEVKNEAHKTEGFTVQVSVLWAG
jgi:hypothetical protein